MINWEKILKECDKRIDRAYRKPDPEEHKGFFRVYEIELLPDPEEGDCSGDRKVWAEADPELLTPKGRRVGRGIDYLDLAGDNPQKWVGYLIYYIPLLNRPVKVEIDPFWFFYFFREMEEMRAEDLRDCGKVMGEEEAFEGWVDGVLYEALGEYGRESYKKSCRFFQKLKRDR